MTSNPFTSDEDWSTSILQPTLLREVSVKIGISINPLTNEIGISSLSGDKFVTIKIDMDSNNNPVGIRIDGVPITTKELKAIDVRRVMGNPVHYKTGPDDLEDLI